MLHTLDITKAPADDGRRKTQALDVARVLAEGRKHGTRQRTLMIAGIAGGLALLALGGWLWWSGALRPAGTNFVTDPVTRADIDVSLVTTGTLKPTQEVPVFPLQAGTIDSVDVDFNARVVRGQPLAHLDMSDLEARVARARALVDVQQANILVAKASLSDAEAALRRAETLGVDNGISQRDIDMSRTAVQRAEASLASASAQLKVAQADFQTTLNDHAHGTITAPIDGVVLDVNAKAGQSIGTSALGQALFVVAADLSELDLEVDIDEADVVQVSEGDRTSFTVEAAPDAPLHGVIRQLRAAPIVSDGVVNYKALISVDNSAMSLRPGMTATAEIAVNHVGGILTISNAALRFAPDAGASSGPFAGVMPRSTVESSADAPHTVWVLADGRPTPVSITTGLTDGQRTQVVDGALAEGDVVITGTRQP